MEPIPTPPDRAKENDAGATRTKYPWHLIELGRWQQWADLPRLREGSASRRQIKRIIQAAHAHAKRSGLDLATRTSNAGCRLDMRFTKRGSE